MNAPSKRRGVMTLRSVGHAFWIGLAISLALHAFLIGKGSFPKAQLEDPSALEARIEPEEFDAVMPAEPEIANAPAASSAPEPEPQQTAAPAAPFPAPAPPPLAEEPPATPTPQPQAVPPLPKADSPPPSAQPHALLTQAADRIRNLPDDVEIVYELKGMLSGRQTHTWHRAGQHYTLDTVAEATGLTGLFMGGQLIQKSSGRIGALGLMPERYEIRRPTGKNETLKFDYAANLIESSRTDAKRDPRTRELPLLTGAQDPLSAIYQLAMAAQDGKDGLIVAASSKRVKGYPYRMIGTEILSTPLGEMKTLHVTRAGDSEKSGTHLWLAPEKYSLPVRVSYVDEDGTQWVLEAVSIKAP